MMAYVDCTFVAITYDNPELCDCNRIIDTDLLPSSPDIPDRQKDLSVKADWKYLGSSRFRWQPVIPYPAREIYRRYSPAVLAGYHLPPFQPPRC